MNYQMQSEVITPELAESWLQSMKINRPISVANVKFLADQIREGKWIDTGVPIVFVGESLVDGQHRLRAVLETKKAIKNAVVRHPKGNAQEGIFPVIDTGRKRTPADALTIAGFTHSKLLAETIKRLAAWYFVQNEAIIAQSEFVVQSRYFTVSLEKGRYLKLDNASYIQMVDRFVGIQESVRFGSNKQRRRNSGINDPLTRSNWSFFHYILHSIDTVNADDFLTMLLKGAGKGFTSSSSPLAQLRETLIARDQIKLSKPQAFNSIDDAVTITLHVFSAWNATRGHGTYKASKLNGLSPIPIPR